MDANLNACHNWTETLNGTTISGTLGATSFPSYGDESAAFTAAFTVSGVSAVQGGVLVKKGSHVTIVALGDIGQLDTASLEQFTAQAVAKLPA